MPAQVTVIIPGLKGPATATPQAAADGLTLPALETLLSRARRHNGVAGPVESLLFSAFGHGVEDADLPVAAVTRVVDIGGENNGWWLRADPVYLRPDRDTLIFMGGAGLGLNEEQAAQLVRELDPVFLARGWHLRMGAAQRWYLRLARDPHIRTQMPARIIGRDIRPHLPSGEQAGLWRMVMNEAQMQLHMSPVNQRREARGLPPVNSVWIWGGGATRRFRAPWSHLWCNHVVGAGLARLSDGDIAPRPVPHHGEEWLSHSVSGGSHLVVIEDLDTDDPQQWRAALQEINDRWMAPLLTAVKAGAVEQLTLISGTGIDFTLTPSASKRWWRRTKRLHDSL